MSETKYTADHEWIRIEGDVATIGITDYAQSALGDVLFVDLPGVGRSFAAGEAIADIVNPVTGSKSTVRATQGGLLFASTAHRYLQRGMHVCKIAGTTAFRSGSLLSQ